MRSIPPDAQRGKNHPKGAPASWLGELDFHPRRRRRSAIGPRCDERSYACSREHCASKPARLRSAESADAMAMAMGTESPFTNAMSTVRNRVDLPPLVGPGPESTTQPAACRNLALTTNRVSRLAGGALLGALTVPRYGTRIARNGDLTLRGRAVRHWAPGGERAVRPRRRRDMRSRTARGLCVLVDWSRGDMRCLPE
jgi:hypothetical protein